MGWLKKKQAAKYAGVSPRTLDKWVGYGLECSTLPTGLRVFKEDWIDEFYGRFTCDRTDQVVDEIINTFS